MAPPPEYTVTFTPLQFTGLGKNDREDEDAAREVTFVGNETKSFGTNKSIFEDGPANDNLVLAPAAGIANFHISIRVPSEDGIEVKQLQDAYETSVGGTKIYDDKTWTFLLNGGQLRLGSGTAMLIFRVRVALKEEPVPEQGPSAVNVHQQMAGRGVQRQ